MNQELIYNLALLTSSMSLLALWFMLIFGIAKYTVGKNAKTWQIMAILIISGPFGWAIIGIMLAASIADDTVKLIKRFK